MTRRNTNEKLQQAGYDLTVKEIRLIAYFVNVAMNEQKLDRAKCSPEEGEIIYKWIEKGYIKTSSNSPWQQITSISEEWFKKCCDIVWLTYVQSQFEAEGK